MLVSILSSVIYHGSTAVDPSFTLADLVKSGKAVELKKGFEVQSGTEVYAYTAKEPFVAPSFELDGTYAIGDIVVHEGKLHKITGFSGAAAQLSQRPKEPEEYDHVETDINFNNWTHRYFRIGNRGNGGGWAAEIDLNYDKRWYYMFYETRGIRGCTESAWMFGAKDLNREDAENRDNSWYKRTCLKDTYSTSYDAGKDVPAEIGLFAAPGMVKKPTLNFKSLINRNGYFYFRTHVPESVAPLEYVELALGSALKYSLTAVATPMDIPGFAYKRHIQPLAVFDGKNYTGCEQYPEDGKVSFTFSNTEDFDAIALGRVISDKVSIVVKDRVGNSVTEINNYPIDNVVLEGYFDEAVTSVLYMPKVIKGEHVVTVTFYGNHIKIGDIVVGITIDAGFTNLEFGHEFKDFSPYEQDQWGNIYYADGVRVLKHNGKVDIKIKTYDHMIRLRRKIGGNEVIINGSDSVSNTPTNSKSIFQSTMMIGRFKTFKSTTRDKGNKIGDIANYTFVIEERV